MQEQRRGGARSVEVRRGRAASLDQDRALAEARHVLGERAGPVLAALRGPPGPERLGAARALYEAHRYGWRQLVMHLCGVSMKTADRWRVQGFRQHPRPRRPISLPRRRCDNPKCGKEFQPTWRNPGAKSCSRSCGAFARWAREKSRAGPAEACLSARAEVARLTARLASAESERDRHRDREDEDGDRRSLRHLLVARPGPLLDAACDEIEGLRAEVARLRAQGEALADCRTARPDGPGCGACCACLGHAVSVAAAAEKAAYLRGRSEAIDDEAGFIRTAIYSIMRRPRSAEEDPTQKPRAAEAEHVADAVARLWREHVAARAAQGQGQGQGPAGPCAHVVRVVDTHPMAPGPGWDLVACERCKAVGHRARAPPPAPDPQLRLGVA